MENGITLERYIFTKIPEKSALTQSANLGTEFVRFLKSMIIEDTNQRKLPTIDVSLTFIEVVDSLTSHLLAEKSSNVLANGYSEPSLNSDFSNLSNPYINFGTNFLKSFNWNVLFNIIGRDEFANLVINKKCFAILDNGNLLQVWGAGSQYHQKGNQNISKKGMFYHTKLSTRVSSFLITYELPDESLSTTLIYRIFNIKFDFKNTPKKYRRLKKLIDRIVANDESCEANHIFNSMIKHKKPKYTVFESATNSKDVVQFLLAIFGQIFPLETWGTMNNKSAIIRKIVSFLKFGAQDYTSIDDLLSKIKLGSIRWLGRTAEISSRQDFELRKQILGKFISWLFSSFITQVVKSFWYVAQIPSPDGIQTLYFTHSTWNRIRNEWLDDYTRTHLRREIKIHASENLTVLEKFNFGFCRFLPKPNDLRLLCIPSRVALDSPFPLSPKDREKNKFEYLSYSNTLVRPTRRILVQKRNEIESKTLPCYARCNSSRDIAAQITKFKLLLKAKYSSIPHLYFFKFDMKHCYDSLNQDKILECVTELFNEDDDNKLYYIRQFAEKSARLERVKFVIKDQTSIEDYDLFASILMEESIQKATIDKNKTIKLTKMQVLEVVKSQVRDTFIVLDQENDFVYKRRHGVFQGFPLLATFCDLVYSKMVEEKFSCLKNICTNTILLRVADDFLIISTESIACMKAKEIISNSSLHKYGAFVNSAKTVYVQPESEQSFVKFIGLQIHTKSLEITREHSKESLGSIDKQKSFKACYNYLKWSFNNRLDDHLINLDLQSTESMLANVRHLIVFIMEALCIVHPRLVCKGHNFAKSFFKSFFLELIVILIAKFRSVNQAMESVDRIIAEVISATEEKLIQTSNREMLGCIQGLNL